MKTYVEVGILDASPNKITLFYLQRRKAWALGDSNVNCSPTIQTSELGSQTYCK
jgi:hypothetical protein